MVAKLKNVSEIISSSSVGGKAFNLIKLKKQGFLVPEFEIVPISKLEQFLNALGINKKLLNNILKDSQKIAFEKLKEIRRKIEKTKFPDFFITEIERAREKINYNKLIIRSSASSEDSISDSFAGIYESHISKNDQGMVLLNIKKIICSLFSERVFFYLLMRKINEFPLSSLIIQEFVNGDISGVMFTNFIKEGKKGILLNFDKGTALSVVEGRSGEELFLENEKVKNNQLLSNIIQINLIQEGKKIERLFGFPQDIEWTINKSKLYILQSRPITTTISKEVRVWDNSNIAESYSGIVLPLTSSYARHIYKATYMDLARKSGLSNKKINENKEIFENLLGFFYGRFYYNMLNWYKMMTFFPGYERNKSNLDRMISAKSKADLDESYKKNVSTYFKIRYYSILAFRYPFFEKEVNKFKEHIKKYFKEYSKHDLSSMSNKELINLYYRSLRELLDKWSVAIENDFLLMTFFGHFQKFAKRINLTEEENLNLLSDIKNVISAEQVNFLADTSHYFSQHKDLIALANRKKYFECLNEIYINHKYSQLKERIEIYMNKYGGRFANELRLETEDFDTNPEYIIKLLNLYKDKNIGSNKEGVEKDNKKINLSFSQRLKLNYLIKKIKDYTRRREELRLFRSQSFSLARKLFTNIGKNFQDQGVLENWKDIFYLEVSEVKQFIEGSSTNGNLIEVISLRKKQYLEFSKIELEDVFITQGDPYSSLSTKIKKLDKRDKNLEGKGCSNGIIKGKIKILNSFRLPEKENFEIIVTKHTDPGWTSLFGLCKGVIVEHGGLLSHAAIISRELNLPCVIGVKGATKKLRDGQIVTINGATGEIKIHE